MDTPGLGLDLGNLLVHLRADASQYDRVMKNAEMRMRNTARSMRRIGRQMSMYLTAPIVAMGVLAAKSFASFDDAMTKSLAIMKGITPALREEMENLALTISTEGVTSAKNLARSYFYLASAGLTAEQSLAALGAVERFAVAGAFDMALATDLATDAQSAMGLTVSGAQKNLENLIRVTDVLTGANTLANATTQQFSLALTSQAGPAMKAYNVELEEGVAVLAAYADQGIKAERAGNMFGRMLRLMTKGFKDNEAAWQTFGLDIYDATGELIPMYDIVGGLTKGLETMSTKQKIVQLTMLGFQARSQQAILPLLGLQDSIKEYNEELLNMQGITREVTEKQLKSFASQMKILWNQIVATGIEIGRLLSPAILWLNERIKSLISSWRGLSDRTKIVILVFAGIVAAAGPVLIALGALLALYSMITPAILAATTAILGWGAAIAAIAAAPFIGRMFYDEFKIVQQVANQVIINLMKGWEYIKYGFKQMVAGMRTAWSSFTSFLLRGFAGTIREIAEGFAALENLINKLPWVENVSLGAESIEKWAKSLEAFAERTGNAAKEMWEQNKKDLEQGLLFLDDLSEEIFSKVEADFAEVGEAAAAAMEEAEEAVEDATDSMGDAVDDLGWKMHDLFEDWAGSALDTFGNMQQIATDAMEGVTDALTDMVMTGKANFNELANAVLTDITRMIIRAQLARVLMGFMPGLVPTPVVAPLPVYQVPSPIGHSGGIVGQMNTKRLVPAAIFANAPRFHSGLGFDEVPTILQKGELVLSKDEVSRGGGKEAGRGSSVNITVQAIDAQDTYRFLSKNKRAIASMLQGVMQSNHPIRRFDR